MNTNKAKINSLNTLRFFMCLTIVIAHMEFLGQGPNLNIFNYYFQNAAVATDFFFILSGFGLTLGAIRKNTAKVIEVYSLKSAYQYAFNRVKKLYKVYIITMIFAIPADLIEKIIRGQAVSSALIKTGINVLIMPTLLQSLSGLMAISHGLNSVAWFFSCLLILYMVYPLLEQLNIRIRGKKTVVPALLITLILTCIFHGLFVMLESNYYPLGFTMDLSHGSPYMRVFHFFLGMLLADILFDKISTVTGTKATILESVTVLATISAIVLGNRIRFGEYMEIKNFIYLMTAMALVSIFALCHGGVSAVLEKPVLLCLGDTAQYVFLIHYVVRQNVDLVFRYFVEATALYNALEVALILIITGVCTAMCMRKK